ncbi:MAG: class I mannose-6-phosphate isomerase [Deltaproteobacteria bacterium]|nr:class I mannose-6-phosphate isomerase [Deltaproteobacteria bacterium]MBN2670193.1 class I mannose-6-phosphate isomerase [Deltaproteobacteria bacterium]
MVHLPILKFAPILKSIVWGGRNMETLFSRRLPSDDPYGESWELVDLDGDGNQSTVKGGPFVGSTIEQLVADHSEALLGTASLLEGRFPLLFKFIDAQQTLSVQVHPDTNACVRLGKGARPKTEAWYIISCEPAAKLYVGLKTGVTRSAFESALTNGTVEQYLHEKSVKPGDYVFLPSGTIHAIGAGIVLAEVQQSSNTTYRVFDWNRVGLDGRPRELHVSEAMESIHFDEFEEPVIVSPYSGRPGVRCDYFSMETVAFNDGESAGFSHAGPIVLMHTQGDGEITLNAEHSVMSIRKGETAVIPACIANQLTVSSERAAQCVVTLVM